MNDKISTFIELKEDNIYFLRVLSSTKVRVLQFQSFAGTTRFDYHTENSIYDLTVDEIDQVKGIVISSITILFELFSNYYNCKTTREIITSDDVNNDLIPLLRFSHGAKVKFLDELMSLYLALDGQTYFDVVAHVVIAGVYTFGSLFSTTGLYYAANTKLIGKTMLHRAIRRSFVDCFESKEKGEIHTSQGLTILHLRQFRLRQRKVAKPRSDTKYELVSIIDEDSNNEMVIQDGSMQSGIRRVYEKVKDYKLLSFVQQI